MSDSIEIRKDNVGLENLVIRDQNNHTANLNVRLSHSNFGRMVYTASLRLNDFMLLNNKERTDLMVYGNLQLTGDLQVTGSPNGIFGNGTLSTQSQSEVMVMLRKQPELPNTAGWFITIPRRRYTGLPPQEGAEFLRSTPR